MAGLMRDWLRAAGCAAALLLAAGPAQAGTAAPAGSGGTRAGQEAVVAGPESSGSGASAAQAEGSADRPAAKRTDIDESTWGKIKELFR